MSISAMEKPLSPGRLSSQGWSEPEVWPIDSQVMPNREGGSVGHGLTNGMREVGSGHSQACVMDDSE